MNDLEDRLAELEADSEDASSLDDLNDLFEEMGSALGDAADDLEDANPPDDVAETHEQVTQLFHAAAEALEDGDISALETFDPDNAYQLPADVEERLGAAAADVEECEGLGLF